MIFIGLVKSYKMFHTIKNIKFLYFTNYLALVIILLLAKK